VFDVVDETVTCPASTPKSLENGFVEFIVNKVGTSQSATRFCVVRIDSDSSLELCNRSRNIALIHISSSLVEKAADIIVARRQKHQGMIWSRKGADSIAVLRTIVLNEKWDEYWQEKRAV